MDTKSFISRLTRRPESSNLLDVVSPSLFQMRQFFDEVEKIKLVSKFASRDGQRFHHQAKPFWRSNRASARKGTRPMTNLFLDQDISSGQIKGKSPNVKQETVRMTSPPVEGNPVGAEDSRYYRRFLLPRNSRIAMEPSITYLTISRIKVDDLRISRKPKIEMTRRAESVHSRMMTRRNNQRKDETQPFIQRCQSPWSSHRRSLTGDF